MKYKIQLCNKNSTTKNDICWIGTPRNEEGDLIGAISFQDHYSLPEWAVSTNFWIWIKKDGKINELIVYKIDSHKFEVVEKSISAKFGRPSLKSVSKDFKQYKWSLKEMAIKMDCGFECDIKFISAELEKSRNDFHKEMEIRESRRPTSP